MLNVLLIIVIVILFVIAVSQCFAQMELNRVRSEITNIINQYNEVGQQAASSEDKVE